MSPRLKHNEYIQKTDNGHRLVRPVGWKGKITYHLFDYTRYAKTPENISNCVRLIRENLTPDFLSSDFIKKFPASVSSVIKDTRLMKFRGLCVPATMVLIYLIDTDDLKSVSAYDDEGMNHWWVEDHTRGAIYDPTGDQYPEEQLNELHSRGKWTPYYGFKQRPASRFLDLIQKIQLQLRARK